MATRLFTRTQLAALGVPPDSPDDVEYSDTVLADEFVTTLKYSAQHRCVFRADDGRAYAVEYEAPLDVGDFEVDNDIPDDHGWYDDTVTATEVEQRPATVVRWVPVEEPTR